MTMKSYQQFQASKPFYTKYPHVYDVANRKIKTWEYVKERMQVSQVTPDILEKACEKFPEIFAWYKLGIYLRPYQHYTVDQMIKSRYLVMCCSRRLGKTTIGRIFILWTSIYNKLGGDLSGTTWNVICQDQDIACDLYIEPLHEMMERGDQVTYENFKGQLGQHWFTEKLLTKREKSGKVNRTKISFRVKEGISRIIALPPTKKAIGREGNIFADELSKWKSNTRVKDEFVFFDQLIAIMKDNPKYRFFGSSTPEGDGDLFSQIFDPYNANPDNVYTKIWFPWNVRLDQHWQKEMLRTREEMQRNGRLHIFQQENEALFISISTPWFPYDAINNAIKDTTRSIEKSIPCSVGVDWGGTTKSQTVITVCAHDGNTNSIIETLYQKAYPVGEDYGVLNDLRHIAKRYNVKWVTPDNKGARFIIPQLSEIFGRGRVHPFNFTTDKQAGYELMRQALINGTVYIPNIEECISQLRTLGENLKPSNSKAKDDRADSLMMALYPLLQQQPSRFRVILPQW